MSKVLFLGIPSHGHMNPTLGLTSELIKNGEEVTFFASEEFKERTEAIGATYKCYKEDLNIFQLKKNDAQSATTVTPQPKPDAGMLSILLKPEPIIADVMEQIQGEKFDYVIFSAAFPFGNTIAQILDIPAISSFAVFALGQEFFNKMREKLISLEILQQYQQASKNIKDTYNVALPDDIVKLLYNKGELNIIYTSKYFIPNIEEYDNSFIFVGPPVYEKTGTSDFPFEKLEGKKVIYISLGTVFSNYSDKLNELFFKTFAGMDVVVVMAAYNVDLSQFHIPDNFIVRNYVPQLDILKYTTVAITHAGMNSIGDLLYKNIPFVSIPLGADQFFLSKRAAELGATIWLDVNTITPELLKDAVDKVLNDPAYLENIKKISQSFRDAGGYAKAVEEIFALKKQKGIIA